MVRTESGGLSYFALTSGFVEVLAGERSPADVPLWLPNRSLSPGNRGPTLDR
jgi:hypothetical protein